MSQRALSFSVCAAGLLATSTVANAQNYRSVPLGGRTATMGGAGVAAGIDSAMPYLNPAGVAGLPGDVLAVSGSLISYERRSVESPLTPRGFAGVFRPVSESEEVRSDAVLDLPSTVFYGKHLSPAGADAHHFIALALVTPFINRLNLEASGEYDLQGVETTARLNLSLRQEVRDIYLGPTYGLELGRRVRLGVSGFLLYTEESVDVRYRASLSGPDDVDRNQSTGTREATQLALAPVVGAQVELVPWVWLGFALAPAPFRLTGEYEAVAVTEQELPGEVLSQVTFRQSLYEQGERTIQRPLRASLGLAYDNPQSFSIAGDVHYRQELQKADVLNGTAAVSELRDLDSPRRYELEGKVEKAVESVVNFSLGVEVPFNELVVGRLGAFTDFSATPKFNGELRPRVFERREDRFGGTLGVGLTGGTFESTVGAVYTFGTGELLVVDSLSEDAIAGADNVTPVSTTSHSIGLVVSGSVTVGEAKSTMQSESPLKLGAKGADRAF